VVSATRLRVGIYTDASKTTKLVELQGNYKNDEAIKGFNGQVFAGFGKTLKSHFYIGGEAWGNYFSGKRDESYNYTLTTIKQGANPTNVPSGHIKISNPMSFGLGLRLGYVVSPKTMFYVLLGFDYAKFNVENTMSNHYTDKNIDENFTTTDKFDKWLPGFMPGIGIEAGITDHLSLRVQGTYAFYEDYEHDVTKYGEIPRKNGLNTPYKINMKSKLNLERITAQLMLSYLFN